MVTSNVFAFGPQTVFVASSIADGVALTVAAAAIGATVVVSGV